MSEWVFRKRGGGKNKILYWRIYRRVHYQSAEVRFHRREKGFGKREACMKVYSRVVGGWARYCILLCNGGKEGERRSDLNEVGGWLPQKVNSKDM